MLSGKRVVLNLAELAVSSAGGNLDGGRPRSGAPYRHAGSVGASLCGRPDPWARVATRQERMSIIKLQTQTKLVLSVAERLVVI